MGGGCTKLGLQTSGELDRLVGALEVGVSTEIGGSFPSGGLPRLARLRASRRYLSLITRLRLLRDLDVMVSTLALTLPTSEEEAFLCAR